MLSAHEILTNIDMNVTGRIYEAKHHTPVVATFSVRLPAEPLSLRLRLATHGHWDGAQRRWPALSFRVLATRVQVHVSATSGC